MTNPKDYLKPENIDKQYLIRLIDCKEVIVNVEEIDVGNTTEIYFTDNEKSLAYELKQVDEVLRELPEDFTDNCDSCNDGKISLQLALNGQTTCDNCLKQQQGLIKFKTKQANVYKYNSIEELQELYKVLGCPVPDNLDKDWNTQTLIVDDLKHSFGLVYTWSHWDDFSDYPLDYCAVIDGGMLSD